MKKTINFYYLFYCLDFSLERRHFCVQLIQLVCDVLRWTTVLYFLNVFFIGFNLKVKNKLIYMYVHVMNAGPSGP